MHIRYGIYLCGLSRQPVAYQIHWFYLLLCNMLYFPFHICEYFSIKTIYIPHNVWYNKDSKRAAAQTKTAQPGRRII